MALIDVAARQVQLKLIYYGIASSGKTANLTYLVHHILGKHVQGAPVLSSEGEQTALFDFVPVDLGMVHGFNVRLQLFSVPGRSIFAASRAALLAHSDAVVLVVDSQASRLEENRTCLAEMRETIRARQVDLDRFPVALQYNKRDLPDVLSTPELERVLNPGSWSTYEAVASRGIGVFDTFRALSKVAIERL